jgi:modulator of FtsH protease HflK
MRLLPDWLRGPRKLFSLNDPGWGRGSNDQKPRRPQDGPPDLDELWRDFNRKLNGLFGKKTGGSGNGQPPSGRPGGTGEGPSMKAAGAGAGVVGVVAALLWLGSGFYIVQEGQAAAVMQFGEFKYLNDRAGFTWRIPYPVQTHEIVNVQQQRQVEIGYRSNVKNKALKESLMLTQDQSIVDMQVAVQYRLSNAVDFLFNNNPGPNPEELIRQGAETALRETVGRKGIDQVLYEEKEAVAKEAQKLMQEIVDRYKAGVTIIDVTIQQAQPPEQVQAAFEDANKAAQDKERLINEGRAYANDVIPKARGAAARLTQEADGHKQRVIATAQGDASRFKQVYTEYAKAPQVTRDRMYIETMQQIFSNTSKVYVDAGKGNSLLYLPLDKIIQSTNGQSAAGAAAAQSAAAAAGAERPVEVERPRESLRNRERESR